MLPSRAFALRHRKKRSTSIEMLLYGIRQRPILPGRVQPSTFGTEGLNCCVRNGNRWDPFVIATGNGELFTLSVACASRLSHCSTFSLPCQALALAPAPGSAGAFPHPDNCTSNDSFQTVFQLVSSLSFGFPKRPSAVIKPSTY